jgi:hypothetical protein
MRKFTLLLFLSALVFSGFAGVDTKSGEMNALRSTEKSYKTVLEGDVIFFEGFESGTLENWTTVDNDGDGLNWVVQTGETYSHSGENFIISESWTSDLGAVTPENWLISPAIDLTAETGNLYVNYYVGGIDPDWALEHYKLVVSTSGTDIADFSTILLEETTNFGPENGYNRRIADLSDYAGETIYLAWVHYDITDQYKIMVDDISVVIPEGSGEAEIVDFTATGGVGTAEIDSENATVSYMVEVGTDLTDLSTTITVSEGAQVTETTTDYTSPVTVLVGAANGYGLKTWTVTVTEEVIVETVNVTFNVDMSTHEEFDAANDTVWITGNFAGWAEPGSEGSMFLTDEDADNVYTLTVEVDENYGELLYKYFDGPSWDNGEWAGDPNRTLTIATEDVVTDDIWGTTSIEANKLAAISLFPNPVKDAINLTSTEGVAEIHVSNVLGQTVIRTNAVANTINVADLNDGIYIVTLVSENGATVSERIVKK